MFIAISLENKPSWRSPPWMTVLLIVINCVIFWGWQAPEEAAVQRAGQRYAQTALPPIELPRFAAYMQEQAGPPSGRRERGLAQAVQALYQHQAYAQLYALMWQEKKFRQLLLDGKIITPADPQYAQWQAARAGFAPQEPGRSFTERWADSAYAFSRVLAEEVLVRYGEDLEAFVEKRFGDRFSLRLSGYNLLDASKDEYFDKFDNLPDQIGRDHDEYEVEREDAGPAFQLVARYSF